MKVTWGKGDEDPGFCDTGKVISGWSGNGKEGKGMGQGACGTKGGVTTEI